MLLTSSDSYVDMIFAYWALWIEQSHAHMQFLTFTYRPFVIARKEGLKMKRLRLCIILVSLVVCSSLPHVSANEPLVPDALPKDFGGITRYGYMMELKTNYLPAKVFVDAIKYTDQDRENARRAAELIILASTQAMEESGTSDQYNLYLRAYAYDLKYQDTREASFKQLALDDYQKTVELGGEYAQADHDRLAALELAAAPLHWQIPQILSLSDAGEILGVSGGNLFFVKSDYQRAETGRQGIGYALLSVAKPEQSTIFVLADPQGGKARYDVLKRFAFLGKSKEIDGLGEEAALFGSRNIQQNGLRYATVLVLKAPLVLQVSVPDHIWRGPGFNMDPEDIALRLARRFLDNLYDQHRSLPSDADIMIEDIMPMYALPRGGPDSQVPDQVPEDLGGKTTYGYIMDLKKSYLKPGIMTEAVFTRKEKDDARQAARLIVHLITEGFDQNGPNAYESEIRGSCYALAYADTKNPVFRLLAINDLKQALNQGNVLAKKQYDELASPLLSPLAESPHGSKGGIVLTLQGWLAQTGYLSTELNGIFDEATIQAVTAYERDHGLTADGIADLAFLLSLYANIDDGDVLFFEY